MGDRSIKSLFRIDDNAGPQKIGFLLLNQFSMIAFASAVEPLRAANRQANKALFEWVVVSAEGQSSTASNGMLIQTNTCIEALKECCIVFVCAGVRVRENTNKAILNLIRRLDRNGAVIGAICTGTYVMAAAGLLDDRRCTIHWEHIDGLSEEFPNLDITNDLFEIDGNRVTCAGAMAAFDLTRQMIQSHLGNAIALDVDAMLMHDEGLGMKDARRPNSGHNPVQRAIAEMHKNIERPLPLSDIAQLATCPLKTLSRRFQASLGTSPGQVYRHIRLTEARQLIESTSLSISEIALRCGYESPTALSRAFRLRFGVAPTALGLHQGAPR